MSAPLKTARFGSIPSEIPQAMPGDFFIYTARPGGVVSPPCERGVVWRSQTGGIPQAKPAELLTYSFFTIH